MSYNLGQQPTRADLLGVDLRTMLFYMRITHVVQALWLKLRRRVIFGRNDPITTEWTTRDGQVIPICELTDRHLQSILYYLVQRMGEINASTAAANAQLDDDDWDDPIRNPSELWPVWNDLIAEAERRSIGWIRV